jgi:cell division inhibitor SepF
MGFGRKVGAFLGLVPDDGRGDYGSDHHGDQYEDFEGSEYAGEYGRDYSSDYSATGYASKGYAAGQQTDNYPEPSYAPDRSADRYPARAESGFAAEPVTQGALAMQPRLEPRRDQETKSGSRPVTIKLTGFAEARVIGEKYRDGQSVIMDMTEMADADARRLVDFAAGLAFAKRGSIDKVTTKVFMLLPSDMDAAEISAEQRREYAGAYGR